ncbi:hypothetical protein [Spirosoma spitsbergense]|uniref:hypothetical protein n=1 Tax=Spirosoma spitsbergense TaxID=431554 RepID=UPI000365D9DD|nr:hypothetical protein [Spirosoma spitsbergense]
MLISDVDKRLHLLKATAYSTADDHSGVLAGVFTLRNWSATNWSELIKPSRLRWGDLLIRHLPDRCPDDVDLFGFIDEQLKDQFVIRAKVNRAYPLWLIPSYLGSSSRPLDLPRSKYRS